jgi:hypothetical protein
MFEDETEDQDVGRADFGGKDGKAKGDGLHHHEIHEDEGGGYHSKHTHPDGHQEHEDHASYEDARDHMDETFGHGEADGDDAGDDDGMDAGDIAGSYGRAAHCED